MKLDPSARLQRSELAVPASSERFMAKAAASDADAVFLDLEDAVADSQKDAARDKAIQALNSLDWGAKTVAVRINGLDTPWALKDLVDVARHAERLDMILLPKASSAFDVQFLEQALVLIEREQKRARPIGIEVLIETAKGVANAEQIAASSPRLEAIIFGIGDYSLDMHTQDFVVGMASERYAILTDPDESGVRHRHWNDQWHFALARIANACHANGLRAIDGPYANFNDLIGYRASAQRSASLGYEGKWAVHPAQIAVANEVFSPSPEIREWAGKVHQLLGQSTAAGDGAVSSDGVLIDLAHAKMARQVQQRLDRIASHEARVKKGAATL